MRTADDSRGAALPSTDLDSGCIENVMRISARHDMIRDTANPVAQARQQQRAAAFRLSFTFRRL